MLAYRCPHCDITCEQSNCPVCDRRTLLIFSKVFWCDSCNVPIWADHCPLCGKRVRYISSDIRPVFPQERLLLESMLGSPLKFKESSVWFGSGNRYIVDGETVKLPTGYSEMDTGVFRDIMEANAADNEQNAFDKYAARWVEANSSRFEMIVSEAMSDREIEARLFPPEGDKSRYRMPDYECSNHLASLAVVAMFAGLN